MQGALRHLAGDARGAMVRLLAYLCGLFVVAVVIAEFLTPPARGKPEPAARGEWVEIARPHAAFAMSFGETGQSEPHYGIRRHINGQGRKDTMSFGTLTGEAASAMVEIYRPGPEFTGFGDPVTEVLARLPDLPLAEGVRNNETIKTKFGPVDLVDFAIERGGRDETARRCLGFAHAFEEPALLVAGWYCNSGPEIVSRAILACGLDRLTLLGAGSEPRLAALFAQADLKRVFCGHKATLLAATPKRADWIEASKVPKLRGRLAAR